MPATSEPASFDFIGVDPHSDIEADLTGGVADRAPATDGAGGAVEGGEHAVTGEPFLVTREARQLSAHGLVVKVEHRRQAWSPTVASWSVEPTTSENNRVVSPSAVGGHAGAGQELFDLVDDDGIHSRTQEHLKVGAGKLHQPGIRDVLGEIPAMLDGKEAVLHCVQDERRRTDGRQDRSYVRRVQLTHDRANSERQPGVPTDRVADIDLGVHGHIVAPCRRANHAGPTQVALPRQIWRSRALAICRAGLAGSPSAVRQSVLVAVRGLRPGGDGPRQAPARWR